MANPLTVAEFMGFAVTGAGTYRYSPLAPQEPYLALTIVSSAGSTASMSTISLSTTTRVVSITQGSVGPAFFFIGYSSTAGAPTSTQVETCPANNQIFRGVNPGAKMWAYST